LSYVSLEKRAVTIGRAPRRGNARCPNSRVFIRYLGPSCQIRPAPELEQHHRGRRGHVE